ncbi:hypothetical protein SLS62_011043 [Diatrype stigma]|uniref:Uncharacterized protein n=1 Tax=Diatrype stigma TaxID=117547 RepID=A0AAN9U7Z3_9PEZI
MRPSLPFSMPMKHFQCFVSAGVETTLLFDPYTSHLVRGERQLSQSEIAKERSWLLKSSVPMEASVFYQTFSFEEERARPATVLLESRAYNEELPWTVLSHIGLWPNRPFGDMPARAPVDDRAVMETCRHLGTLGCIERAEGPAGRYDATALGRMLRLWSENWGKDRVHDLFHDPYLSATAEQESALYSTNLRRVLIRIAALITVPLGDLARWTDGASTWPVKDRQEREAETQMATICAGVDAAHTQNGAIWRALDVWQKWKVEGCRERGLDTPRGLTFSVAKANSVLRSEEAQNKDKKDKEKVEMAENKVSKNGAAAAQKSATKEVEKVYRAPPLRSIWAEGSNIGASANEPAWTEQLLIDINAATVIRLPIRVVAETRRVFPDKEGRYVTFDNKGAAAARAPVILNNIPTSKYCIELGKTKLYSDVVMRSKDGTWITNQWTCRDIVIESVPRKILGRTPRSIHSSTGAGKERRIGHDFLRIGLSKLYFGPVFETLRNKYPKLLRNVLVTVLLDKRVLGRHGEPRQKLSEVIRMFNGKSSLCQATIAISTVFNGNLSGNTIVKGGESCDMSVELHNAFHIKNCEMVTNEMATSRSNVLTVLAGADEAADDDDEATLDEENEDFIYRFINKK